MSFPPGTEMFQFPGFASCPYVFRTGSPCGGVAPFGYLWIKTCSRFPKAFRSVPRPSSPPGAKASTECPFVVQYFAPSEHRTMCDARQSHTYHQRTRTRFFNLPTMHRNHPSEPRSHHRNHFKTQPLGTADLKTPTTKIPKNFSSVPARNSCNIHGHHNRNHCIIIHLNTRNFCNYSSWLTPLPRSDNPLPKDPDQNAKDALASSTI